MKKILTSIGLALTLVACSSSNPNIISHTTKTYTGRNFGKYNVDSETYVSKAQNERIQFIILHYTAGNNEASIKELTSGKVSSHFLVLDNDDNTVYNLVPVDKRAWHAGSSSFGGRTNINDTSVGIEIVNDGIDKKYRNYPTYHPYDHYVEFNEKQIEKVAEIIKNTAREYNIPAKNILAHSDIAPGRKQDPGAKFPWKLLYDKYQIGAWYDETDKAQFMDEKIFNSLSIKDIKNELKKYGYSINSNDEWDKEGKDVVYSFQLHFNPKNASGVMDLETYAILKALNKKYSN